MTSPFVAGSNPALGIRLSFRKERRSRIAELLLEGIFVLCVSRQSKMLDKACSVILERFKP